MRNIYIDSNLYISALGEDVVTRHIAALLERADTKQINLVSSVLVYGEVIKTNSSAETGHILLFLDALPVAYPPINKEVMLQAAQLRLDNPALKLPDAIHLATALANGCDVLLSEDKQLTKIANKYLPAGSILSTKY